MTAWKFNAKFGSSSSNFWALAPYHFLKGCGSYLVRHWQIRKAKFWNNVVSLASNIEMILHAFHNNWSVIYMVSLMLTRPILHRRNAFIFREGKSIWRMKFDYCILEDFSKMCEGGVLIIGVKYWKWLFKGLYHKSFDPFFFNWVLTKSQVSVLHFFVKFIFQRKSIF